MIYIDAELLIEDFENQVHHLQHQIEMLKFDNQELSFQIKCLKADFIAGDVK